MDESFSGITNGVQQKESIGNTIKEIKEELNEGKKFGTYPITIRQKDGTYDFFCF